MGSAGPHPLALRWRILVPNALSPEKMSAGERLDEIGRILAVGIARARQAKSKPSNINKIREVSLDFGAPQRGHVLTKRRRGEKT